MGPKPKAGEPPAPSKPEIDPKEIVTELEKQFFEFQLADIEKKLKRISVREEELKAKTIETEEKIIAFKSEQGAIVDEYEQKLQVVEEEKCAKREEMDALAKEIKDRIEKHKTWIEDQQKKYNEMVSELTGQLKEMEDEVRMLDDFKQEKASLFVGLTKMQEEMDAAEVQHQRNLFEIETKLQQVVMKVKKELLGKLLSFSIEFREANQHKIGNPCHRVTQENKAIQTVLILMKREIFEYEAKSREEFKAMQKLKNTKHEKQLKLDKLIARTVIQLSVIKTLKAQKLELIETLKSFQAIQAINNVLLKKEKDVSDELHHQCNQIEVTKQEIGKKVEESHGMREAMKHLQKTFIRLKHLTRNSLKIAEEARSHQLVPMGCMEEEKYLLADAKMRLFKIRRDNIFSRKGNILRHLLDVLSTAQLTEDDKKLLATSTFSLDLAQIDFSSIYGSPEMEDTESIFERTFAPGKKQLMFTSSMTSLPRSGSGDLSQEWNEEENEEENDEKAEDKMDDDEEYDEESEGDEGEGKENEGEGKENEGEGKENEGEQEKEKEN